MLYGANPVPIVERDYRVNKYERYLQVPRTAQEIADEFGQTFQGTHSSLRRMVKRGDVVIVTPAKSLGHNGLTPGKYLWHSVPRASAATQE
jgi:hypothetical protein